MSNSAAWQPAGRSSAAAVAAMSCSLPGILTQDYIGSIYPVNKTNLTDDTIQPTRYESATLFDF